MKATLLILAAVIALAGAGYWYSTGANRGWTKNRVEVRTLDEVTGIEGSHWEDRFVPGLDFLSITLGTAAFIAGVSFFFRTKKQN